MFKFDISRWTCVIFNISRTKCNAKSTRLSVPQRIDARIVIKKSKLQKKLLKAFKKTFAIFTQKSDTVKGLSASPLLC